MIKHYIKSTKDYYADLYLDNENLNSEVDRVVISFRNSDIAVGTITLTSNVSVSFDKVKIQNAYLGWIFGLVLELQKTWLKVKLTGGVPRDFIEVSYDNKDLVPNTIYLDENGNMIMRLNAINGRGNIAVESIKDLCSLITLSKDGNSLIIDRSLLSKIDGRIFLEAYLDYPAVIDTLKVYPKDIKNYLLDGETYTLEDCMRGKVKL